MEYEAVVAIVERGKANDVVKKAVEAGANGATIAFGRGSGEHVLSFFRSLQIEPAKEIIVVIAPRERVDGIFEVIVEAARIREKGKGIAFCLPIARIAGIGGDGG
ncbi:MAG: P-II family nitrogen regulator [Planctomycetota bacterium]|jgi:nitrogen regulatory protein PII|nr:P-II family nitrogen regulator [Planctomycetota bacterium]